MSAGVGDRSAGPLHRAVRSNGAPFDIRHSIQALRAIVAVQHLPISGELGHHRECGVQRGRVCTRRSFPRGRLVSCPMARSRGAQGDGCGVSLA